MKPSRSLAACLLALVAWLVLAFSPAAADAANPKPQVIDTLNIKNATFGEVADMLRKETGENIMVAPGLQDEMAPQIMLRHVTLEGVLDAICEVTGFIHGQSRQDGTVIWNLMPANVGLPDQPVPKPKICRVFKASAKEKLTAPQLDQLLANISDAARKVCEVNAKAQGRAAAEAPVIEAHAGTGILIVAGAESDVQLVGQVIQALGGEVVPLTSSVMNPNGPFYMKDAEGRITEFEGFITSSSPITSVPDFIEDTRKQLETARDQAKKLGMFDQVKKLEKQLEQLGPQTPAKVLTPTPPPAQPTPPKVK